jgi:hypothetical protein
MASFIKEAISHALCRPRAGALRGRSRDLSTLTRSKNQTPPPHTATVAQPKSPDCA